MFNNYIVILGTVFAIISVAIGVSQTWIAKESLEVAQDALALQLAQQ